MSPRILDLNRRHGRILEAPMLDLEGLAVLATDYEATHMPRMAVELRKKLEQYREREIKIVWRVNQSHAERQGTQRNAVQLSGTSAVSVAGTRPVICNR